MAFAYDFAVSIAVTTDSMPVTIAKLTFIYFTISIFQDAEVELIIFKLALKLVSIIKFVIADQLVVIFPLTIERVTILIRVSALTISFSVSDSSKKVLIGAKIDFGLTFQGIFFELAFILGVVTGPNIHAFAVFLGHGVLAMEEITIGVEDFALTLDVGLMPVGLDFGAVGEGNGAKAMFASIDKVALIKGSIVIEILSPSILFTLDPLSLIVILIGIPHGAVSFLNIILPLTFINITIRIAIPAPALFSVLDAALIGLSVFEDISAVDKLILEPGSEVDVT
jgi:hypothetical protein